MTRHRSVSTFTVSLECDSRRPDNINHFQGQFMESRTQAFSSTRFAERHEKELSQVIEERRATNHFKPEPVPEEDLEQILHFAGQAPSGYNLQPWRIIVVRDAENRKKLQGVAFDQEKIR